LVPVPEDQKALARMQRLRAKGLSLRAIRDRMRQHGIAISHAGVRNALRARAQREVGTASQPTRVVDLQ
jgi:hypothetical protein